MPDDPLQPPPVPTSAAAGSPSPAEPEVNASSLDLPSNLAAALACVPLIGGIVFYVLEKRDGFVRFYAMQSIIFGGAWFLFWIIANVVAAIFRSVPAIGLFLAMLFGLVAMLINLVFVVIWIVATVKAFTNVRWEIPYIGPVARKQTDRTAP